MDAETTYPTPETETGSDPLANLNANLVQFIKLTHAMEPRRERLARENARENAQIIDDGLNNVARAIRDQTAYFRTRDARDDARAQQVTLLPFVEETKGFWARVFGI